MKHERNDKRLSLASLCTGYGGLDMAAMVVFGGQLVWCADNDKHVARVIAARYPGVLNYGDLTQLDWSNAPPIDLICVGFPCQDISYSGKGLGIEKGARSGIWKNIVTGIRTLRPTLVIVENVAAIRTRGLARVLGDLASLGYDSVWTSVRASDIGAPHRRERVFILGHVNNAKARALFAAADALRQREPWWPACLQARRSRSSGQTVRRGDDASHREQGQAGTQSAARTAPYAAGQQRNQRFAQTAKQQRQFDASFDSDRVGYQPSRGGGIAWGRYEAAIRKWERLTGRHAPYPIESGTKDQPRLAPVFSEWMMGLPRGFVTSLDLPYGAQHRALGNGVVPQQAVKALSELVAAMVGADAAHAEQAISGHGHPGAISNHNGGR